MTRIEPTSFASSLGYGPGKPGLLFGDDWSWDGVRMAVERFAAEEQRKITRLRLAKLVETEQVTTT